MEKKNKMEEEQYDALDCLLFKALKNYDPYEKEWEIIENTDNEPLTVSRRHKIRMNRIFREEVVGTFLPFPEVDNAFEKVRSRVVVWFEKKRKQRQRGQ